MLQKNVVILIKANSMDFLDRKQSRMEFLIRTITVTSLFDLSEKFPSTNKKENIPPLPPLSLFYSCTFVHSYYFRSGAHKRMVSRDAAGGMLARRRFRRIGATISYPYTASCAVSRLLWNNVRRARIYTLPWRVCTPQKRNWQVLKLWLFE